jgi:methylmalonyl-CoA mutase
LIVAGNPECAEELQAVGIADFIHIRSNPIEVLTSWQQRLGIKA